MFKITDYITFNDKGRGCCPSCEAAKGKSNLNLSLLESGAYHCFAGCDAEMVRAAVGDRAPRDLTAESAQAKKATKPLTCTPQDVKKDYHRLLENGAAIAWLENRGITQELMARHQLGIKPITVIVNREKYPTLGISIPVPANSELTHYYRKYRVLPWADIDGGPKWHQPGVPATVWFTHKPAEATETWLCEGEWDAIRLGDVVRASGRAIAVASFTCGANSVPGQPELDRLVGKVSIFYDRNDTPLPNGKLPGEEGAKKVAAALGDRATIKLVPGTDKQVAAVKGWDCSNALDAGYSFADFQTAAIPEVPKPELDLSQITKTRKGRLLELLIETYGEGLRYNEMFKQIEKISTGDILEPDFVYLELLMQGLDVGSKEFALDAFNYMAKRNSYSPVKQYLEKVYAEHGNKGGELLNTAATRYLGHTDWLYLSFVRKTLISAVARAMDPGCKVDTTLIFTGKQGAGKSSFWDKLAGDWFCDSLSSSTSDPEEKLKLHSAWIHEWGELESVFKRKETSQVKAFLTSRSDTFREPWGRTTKKHPRISIIVGTTNTDDFLSDPTGDRRYWVIPIQHRICLELLERERDVLWAAAVHAYKQGYQWELTDEEKAESSRRNKQFQSEDPWFSQVSLYLDVHDQVRVTDVLREAINLELSKQDRIAQMRIADILKQLGWEKQHTKLGKIWVKGEKGSHGSHQEIEGNPRQGSNGDYHLLEKAEVVVTTVDQNNGDYPSDHPPMPVTTSRGGVVTPLSQSEQGSPQSVTTVTTKNGLSSPSANSPGLFADYKPGDSVWVLVNNQWAKGTYDKPRRKLIVSPQVTGLHESHWVTVGAKSHEVTLHELQGRCI